MCGIAGLIHRDGTGEYRPGDDGHAAVAEASRPGFHRLSPSMARRGRNEFVMRFKVAEQEDMNKGFDIHDESSARRPRSRSG